MSGIAGGSEKSSAGVGGLVKIPLDCTVEALGLLVSEKKIFLVFPIVSLWRLSTPGAWPNLTPGAWLAQFM